MANNDAPLWTKWFDPKTNSWAWIPDVEDDGKFNYKNVEYWYHHKGHRSWGYGDEAPGYHPHPYPFPSKRPWDKHQPLGRFELLFVLTLFIGFTIWVLNDMAKM